MNDYPAIADIILHYQSKPCQPADWAVWAADQGFSPDNFRQLTQAWAGLLPVEFLLRLSSLTAAGLARGKNGFPSAGAGCHPFLSLPLDVEWQERDARRCPGSVLTAGFADSPLGCCLLAESLQGLCHLAFADGAGEGQGLWAGLQTRWPGVAVRRDDAWAKHLARRIFQPFPPAQIAGQPAPESGDMRLDGEPLRVLLRGTAFQWRVWQALIKIPPGCLVSYGQLAESIGKPGAARAVGSAVGKNPVAYLIPCHRVVQGTGEVGGYRWGCARKRAMLLWESGFCP